LTQKKDDSMGVHMEGSKSENYYKVLENAQEKKIWGIAAKAVRGE